MNSQGTGSKSKPSSSGESKKGKALAEGKPIAQQKNQPKVTQVKEEPEEVETKSRKVLKGLKAVPRKSSPAAVNPVEGAAATTAGSTGLVKPGKRKLKEVGVDAEEGQKKSKMVAKGTSMCAPEAPHPTGESEGATSGTPESNGASGDAAPVHEQTNNSTGIPQCIQKALQNVQDIDSLLRSQLTEPRDCQPSPSTPAMISEGGRGKFRSLNFYWLQIINHPKTPGSVYIFGKVKTPPPGNGFSSCCVIVNNLDRRVFLLPREKKSDGTPVDYMDVVDEFSSIVRKQYGITSFKAEGMTGKCCFENREVRQEAEYVKIRYSGTQYALPADMNGETFSYAFTTNESLVGTFLLEKKLQGPSWLRTFGWRQVDQQQLMESWSKFEFTCDGSSVEIHPEDLTIPAPTLVLASVNFQWVSIRGDSHSMKEKTVFAGVAVNRSFHLESPSAPNGIFQDYFGLYTTEQNWRLADELARNERILEMESEQKLIELFVEKLHNLDADILVGAEYAFDALLRRIRDLKVEKWSRLGRLRKLKWKMSDLILETFKGRLFLDTQLTYDGAFFDPYSYPLTMRTPSQEQEPRDFFVHAEHLARSLRGFSALVKRGLYGCVHGIQIINEVEAIPLAFQASRLVGASLNESLFGVLNTTKWDFREIFTRDGNGDEIYCSDDTTEEEMNESEWKADCVQKVLTSKVGFCQNFVLRLKFQHKSIQRSALMQEFIAEEDNDREGGEPRPALWDEARKLVQRWKEVREILAASNLTEVDMQQNYIQLKALAWALDVLFKHRPPIYSKDIDKAKSHAVILKLGETLGAMGLELVLGFEDWIVLDTQSQDYSTVVQMERKVVDEILRTHPLLEVSRRAIQCFSVFNTDMNKWLSVSKYTVDVPAFVADMAHACFREILCDQSDSETRRKISNILRKQSAELRDGTVALEKLVLTKNLAKDPKEYEQGSHEELADHVRVALRMNKYGRLTKKFGKGDKISYLVGMNGQLYHSSEIISGLKFDEEFYWVKITQPLVRQILAMVPGFDGDELAHEWGLGPCASEG